MFLCERKGIERKGKLTATFIVALVAAFLMFYSLIYGASAVEDESTIDFVLVLDNSGTMASSDPEGLTVSAAKMFIDMLPQKNARVAVVEFGSNYGEDAFSGEKYKNWVSVPFPLSDISTIDQKESCKQVIGETSQDGQNTPVGYAFQAACDVLEQGGATPGDAGILLISDFRLQGEPSLDADGWEYESLNDAESRAAANQWPVYTLEMNFDGKNDNPTEYYEKIAAKIRSEIPEKVGNGSKYIPMTDAKQAQANFAEIFRLFFDPNNNDDSQIQNATTNENGDAEFSFTVGEMVAELNVTLTCDDTSLINSIDIGHGSDMRSYDLTGYVSPIQEEDRIITKEEKYITIKLMVPMPDEAWKVVVHGAANTDIGMYALSIHDMNFQLVAVTDSLEAEGKIEIKDGGLIEVGPNTNIQFNASYIYNGLPYISSKVYSAYPAYLEVTPEGGEVRRIEMTPSESAYTTSYLFETYGNYSVKAVVMSDMFRTGSIQTGTYTVMVHNLPARVSDKTIEKQTLEPGKSFELNCQEYFISPDNDPLTYSVNINPQSGDLSITQEDNKLTVTAGKLAGNYTLTVLADDGHRDEGQAPAEQSFELEVTNRSLEKLIEEEELSLTIAMDRDSVPGILKRFAKDDSASKEENIRLNWEDYFSDPDGYDPIIVVKEDNPENAIVIEQDEKGMTLSPGKPGKASFVITAQDANDPSIEQTLNLNISAYSAMELAIRRIRIPAIILMIVLIIVLIFLILLLTGRKIFGIWDVVSSGELKSDQRLASFRSGKKSSCKLGNLLDDLGMGDEVDDAIRAVQLSAGNRFAKTVTFSNFISDMEVEKNAIPLDEVGPKTKITLNAGNSIRISSDGTFVEMSRH